MTEVLDFLKLHWDEILEAYALLVAFASVVVKITPTIKDDNALLAVIKFVSKYIALNRTTPDDEIRKLQE